MYSIVYGICDKFNRALHDRKWPHKHGGNHKPGDSGTQHSFALAAILENTFNVYRSVNQKDLDERYDFRQYCYDLADELFDYANSLPN